MLFPTRADFLRGSPQPLTLMLPQPAADVFQLYGRMARPGAPSFLLESGMAPSRTARYSFMGHHPYCVVTGWNQRTIIERGGQNIHLDEPAFRYMATLMREGAVTGDSRLPPFVGGAVGFLSYDWVRTYESIPSLAVDDLALPLLQFAFVDLVAAVDHVEGRLYLMYCPPPERFESEPREKLYREGCDRLAELEARLAAPMRGIGDAICQPIELNADQARQSYTDRVRRCQEYIAAGDIYQANISHRFTLKTQPRGVPLLRDPFPAIQYARLRSVNPAPFSAYLCFENVALVSSSPERLICLNGRRAETRPIAGTRPRGDTTKADRQLIADLMANAKERAEHLMLVDLERNDLGRVCAYGSVRVDDFMTVEQYSHVSHIVSNVVGELRSGVTGFDLVQALFPGGTITGVPKIRCMEIIEELEPTRRGPYTGALGYFSWTGGLDFNILIRSLVVTPSGGYLQVGAGIVADSDPDSEYDETLHKAHALFAALGRTL